ncbi:helix-turn-helix transcriptional regulator [Microvirga rosea]|uniref:helix-turn-helix transcriptional regulator n=1 Tax=Microvirga rosea TaxID=2715425 RepID=UPI001D0AF78E|nr:helix-turn-helix domain-containing protein [Microvirga rosea]MCB8820912.1 helix-turn-helix domain-containing protein [Microvirga rosea]
MAQPTEILTEREAAAYLKLSTKSLANGRVYGTGPEFVKLGRAVRYERAALDRWIARGRRRSTSDATQTA